MKNALRLAVVAVGMLAPGLAPAAPSSVYDRPDLGPPLGLSVQVGGGFIQFTGATANAAAPLGGSWTARFLFGTRSHLGWEVAYLGTAQRITALGAGNFGRLFSNGLEGALRFNALTRDWQPYFSLGFGWRRYAVLTDLESTSGLVDAATVTELPLALGLAYRLQGLVADLRCELRPVVREGLLPGVNTTTWGVGARIGFEL